MRGYVAQPLVAGEFSGPQGRPATLPEARKASECIQAWQIHFCSQELGLPERAVRLSARVFLGCLPVGVQI